jgi:hypothetical protein
VLCEKGRLRSAKRKQTCLIWAKKSIPRNQLKTAQLGRFLRYIGVVLRHRNRVNTY